MIYALIAIVIIAAIILAMMPKGKNETDGKDDYSIEWPYYASKLMTEAEQKLYWKLQQALPENIIAVQVQASRVLRVKKGNNFGKWFNKINRLSYDYVICKKDSTPIAVIELDDSSHNEQSRQDADKKKDKATTDAGLKIIRWNIKNVPETTEIEQIIASLK